MDGDFRELEDREKLEREREGEDNRSEKQVVAKDRFINED